MVERPIKKAELAKRREAEAAAGGDATPERENRGDRGDRKERGRGKGGRGKDRGGEPRAAINPALMRGPKPQPKVEVVEPEVEEVAAEAAEESASEAPAEAAAEKPEAPPEPEATELPAS
jgi:hypothetical protein